MAKGRVFTLALPGGQDAASPAIWSRGGIKVDDRARVLEADGSSAPLVNLGSLGCDLGADSLVGDLSSESDVVLRDRAVVQGSIHSAGSIALGNASQVSGAQIAHEPLGQLARTQRLVTFPLSASPLSLEPNTSASPSPGSYGSLTVKSGAHLHLETGSYSFASVLLEPGSTLHADISQGPVFVDVRDAFVLRGSIANGGALASHLLFSYLGTQMALVEAPLVGTLFAPNAAVKLESVGGVAHRGAVFGNGVELHPDGQVTHVPFVDWELAAVRDENASPGRRSTSWDVAVTETTIGRLVEWQPLKSVSVDLATRFAGLLEGPPDDVGPWLELVGGDQRLLCAFDPDDSFRLFCDSTPTAALFELRRAADFRRELGVALKEIVKLSDLQWEAWFCRLDPDCDLGCWLNQPSAGGAISPAWRADFEGWDFRSQQGLEVEIRTLTPNGFEWQGLLSMTSADESSGGAYKQGVRVDGYAFAQRLDIPLGDTRWQQRGHDEIEARFRVRRTTGEVCGYLDASHQPQSELRVRATCGALHGACCLLPPECPGVDACGLGRCVRGLPTVESVSRYPDGAGGGFAPEANGVAHGEANWYFANTPNDENWVWRYPISSSIVGDQQTYSRRVFAEYDHIGDLDYYGGFLYVPLELEAPGHGSAIGVLDPDLNEVALRPLTGSSLPWLAVDPATARIYTSDFNDTRLRVYQIVDPGPDVELVPLPDVPLRLPPSLFSLPIEHNVARIQGGVISPSGTLYLVSDVTPVPAAGPPFSGGIQAVVAETGVARFSLAVAPAVLEELEGIDYWDLETARPPGVPQEMRGQLHLLVLQNDPLSDASDHFSFLHFGTAASDIDEL